MFRMGYRAPRFGPGNSRLRSVAGAFLLVAVALCVTIGGVCDAHAAAITARQALGDAVFGDWEPIFLGVELAEASATKPRPLEVHVVRVDLRKPRIRFLVTPSNGDRPKDCDACTTPKFLEKFKCQVAINGSFFAPLAKRWGDPQDVLGLSISRGNVYSPADNRHVLLISKRNKVRLARPPIDTSDVWNGLAGDRLLLRDGRNVAPHGARHPRSAVGLSKDGRYLMLMAIDGRQPDRSEGVSKAETAEWLRKFGAWDALNLDGGGSTNLVMESSDGKAVLINHPPLKYRRAVANHLGVFARPLPRNAPDATPAD